MESLFILRVLLSFVIGGAFVATCTLLADRRGTTLGGMMGGFPSTMAISLLFIAINNGTKDAVTATTIMPLSLACSGIYLGVYGHLSRIGFLTGLLCAIGCWIMLCVFALSLPPQSFGVACLLCALVFLVSLQLQRMLHLTRETALPTGPISCAQFVARGLFGGTVIGAAVLLSKLAGPLIGGVIACFPAVFTSTLTITSLTNSVEFSRGLLLPMLLSSQVTCLIYIVVVRYLYPESGIVLGTLAGFLCSGASALILHKVLRHTRG